MITKGAKPVNQKEKMIVALHLPLPSYPASGEVLGWHLPEPFTKFLPEILGRTLSFGSADFNL
jgi:hypothetical protein